MSGIWPFSLPPTEWKDVTAGVGSTATVFGLLIGGWVAQRKFRTTPQSRLKVDLQVGCNWHDGDVVVVAVDVENLGGKTIRLLWSNLHRSADESAIDFASFSVDDDHDGLSVSRLSIWPMRNTDWSEPSSSRPSEADWPDDLRRRIDLGCSYEELRPTDRWSTSTLLRVTPGTIAVRCEAVVWIETQEEARPFDASVVAVRPPSGEETN